MKLFQKSLSLAVALMLSCAAYAADEECPTTANVAAHMSSNTIPTTMPYPVNMADPYLDPFGKEWFVVTSPSITLRGAAVKYVSFAVFKDPSATGGSEYTRAQAIAHARQLAGALSGTKSVDVDYPHFYIGDGPDGTQYHFDVCMYQGAFDVPVGTRDATSENMSNGSLPIVMADLSPGISSNRIQSLMHQFEHHESK